MNGQKKKTDPSARIGLTEEEAARSREAHGANILTKQKGKGFLGQFFSNLNDPVIRILLGALCINLLLLFRGADWIETLGIGVAVLLATLISTLSEYTSGKAFERLRREASNTSVRVRRGSVRQIPMEQIVVGDVVLLSAGEQIPADGYLLSGEVRTDQSPLTGENREIRKTVGSTQMQPASKSSLFRGCTVTLGACEYLVTAVGDHTALGEISREIQSEQRESPLKQRLSKLARQISVLGYIASLLVAFAYLFNTFFIDSGMNPELIRLKLINIPYLFEQLLHALTLALTVIVVAVPEGLPMMIAVVLSSNIRKMVKDQVLVRKPVGIESAGSMNILFTDKTGTLTEGKMQVASLILPSGEEMSIKSCFQTSRAHAELASLCFRFGNEASVGKAPSGSPIALGGSSTERALLQSVLSFPEPVGYRVLSRLPFDSARKYSAVSLGGKRNLTLLLGAPEILLPLAGGALDANLGRVSLDRRKIQGMQSEHTRAGERVLALLLSDDAIPATLHESRPKGSFSLVCMVCIKDSLRRDARTSVRSLQEAGIGVVMITGDNPETARTVAEQAGILTTERPLLLTGEELSQLSDAKLKELLPTLAVVARALPSDKSRLVRLSQECGLVVGMTGDGINDAPALRYADVGFSMGSGTQVAKDAGDIIILDDSLASIVRAVLYGRTVFKSIRKFITLQLTMNFCAMGVTMICPFLGIDSPVTVVQMLWINIIMDTLGGLAFAGEPPMPDYMKEPPKKREEPILNGYMINQILLLGSFTVGLCLYFLTSPAITALFRPAQNRIYLLTAFFALFIFSSVFNCFNARSDRLKMLTGLSKNPVFLIIMLAILVIQLVFVYLGGSVLRTAPLLPRELLLTMLLSLSVFPADLLRKALCRLFGKKNGY
ncbi:MAG: calcium-translocating P-type ATPase, PMCA-type [Clostridia bacterium]|nr:calcium-translocating P-type ATPase, PMCA-type [Clostridia bacterium]